MKGAAVSANLRVRRDDVSAMNAMAAAGLSPAI